MSGGARRRVLLLSPGFHSYWSGIASALASQGAEVRTVVYDAPRSMPGKVRNKALHELPTALQPKILRKRLTDAAVRLVRSERPDAVVVVKGDLFEGSLWEELDRRRTPRVLWLYDEIRRTHHSRRLLERVGPIASYSRADVAALQSQGLPAEYVPLAFDHRTRFAQTPVGAVTFVGAHYRNREVLLREIAAAGIPVRAYGNDWSASTLTDIDRRRRLAKASIPTGPSLVRADAYGVFKGSRATLNIHGDQDGFTMRTFEAAGVGAVQLIDRSDTAELYEPGTEVLPFADAAEAAELCRRAMRDVNWARTIRDRARARTLAEHTFDHRARALEALWA